MTVLQRDLVYNEAGHHDPQARVMVLTKDVADDPRRPQEGRAALHPRQRRRLHQLLADEHGAQLDRRRRLPAADPDQHGGRARAPREVRRHGLRRRLERLELPAGRVHQGPGRAHRKQAAGAVTCKAERRLLRRTRAPGCRIPERDSWTPPEGLVRPVGPDDPRAVVRRLRAAHRLHPRPPLRRARAEPRPVRRAHRRAEGLRHARPPHRGLPAADQRRVPRHPVRATVRRRRRRRGGRPRGARRQRRLPRVRPGHRGLRPAREARR